MSKVLSPVVLFWIIIAIAFLCYKLKRKKATRFFLVLGFINMFLFTLSPLPVYILRSLEQQYQPVNNKQIAKSLPVLILGGGHTKDANMNEVHKLSEPALSRLVEGIRIYTTMEGTTLVFSGYSNKIGKVPQAEVMAKAALTLGVQAKDTIMLTEPATTWDEAIAFKKRFGTKKKFILVTSASHMPRAMETFKRQGLHPIPAPADYSIKKDPETALYNWWPSTSKAKQTEKALHEYVGILYYRWFKE